MIKKIVLIAEVDGEITKNNLRLSIDDEGSIVLYPKEQAVNFSSCSVSEVSCGVSLSIEEMEAVDEITSIYKLPFEAYDEDNIVDCEADELMSIQYGIDTICGAIAYDKGALLNKVASEQNIKVFKNLCSKIGLPTNWEEYGA